MLANAAILGVQFEQVGGFIATFTRLGVSAEESTTALRAIFTSMLKPMKETADALATVNLTSAELRDQLGREGLVSVLDLLIEKFGGNIEMLAKVVPNVRAFTGVLGTAGVQGEAFAQITENIANSLGIVEEGFKRVQQTPAQQWKVFTAEAQKMGIELGAKLIPSFLRLIDTLQDMIDGWTKLSDPIQNAIIKIAGFAVIIGPLIWSVGLLGKAYLVLTGFIVKATVALHVFHGLQIAVQLTFAATIAGFVAIGVALFAIAKAALDAEKAQLKLLEVQQRTMETGAALADIWNAKIMALKGTNAELFETFKALRQDLISQGVGAIRAAEKAWFDLEIQTTLAADAARRAADAARAAADAMVPPLTDAEKAAAELSKTIQKMGEEMKGQFDTAQRLKAVFGESFDLTAERASIARAAIREFIAEGADLDTVLGTTGITLRELANFVNGYDQSLIDAAAAISDARDEQARFNQIMSIAGGILSSIETPLDTFTRKLNEARVALTAGAISFGEYLRFAGQISKELSAALKTTEEVAAISGEQIGQALVRGMISGLRAGDLGEALENTAWMIVQRVISVFVGGLFIASPSKLAIGWGRSVVEGFAIGLSGADAITFSPVFGGVSAGVGVGGGSPAPASAGPSAPAALPAGRGGDTYITQHVGFGTEGERLNAGRAARQAGRDALTGVI